VLRRPAPSPRRGTIAFRLDGTVSIDAGPLGQPSFGPSTWLRGDLATRGLISRPNRVGW